MSVAGSRRRDTITYGVNGTRSNCGEQGVSWLCWCGWGSCATILFVGARGRHGVVPGRPFSGHVCGGYLFLLPGLLRTNHSILFCPRCNGVRRRGLSLLCTCPVRGGWGSTARRPRSMTGACTGGDLVRERAHVRGLAGSRPARLVVLVTAAVVWDTPLDCHFSAWSRPKPAPDPPLGPSVASGVIPTKGARNEVLQPPAGRAPQGRWRSSPWKRCNHAPPRSRGQGAPRTARCIKTP